MDIKITNSSLKKFLDTKADVTILSENISLCGPTFDRIHETEGDYVFEIEAITNRIDTASAQGVAREAATILTQFGIPAKFINDPYKLQINLHPGLPKQFHFNITDKDLVVRFVAVSLSNISIKPSPAETQKLLTNCDQRPINNAVDITNELTILYGMPSHVFDLDKLAAQKLTIRQSTEGEEIITLDDTKNKLRGQDIVIEDGTGKLVDLCGVMGGQVAEVDEHTKNILLIVPTYHPKKVRRTSLYLQKRTLASQLYEKQPDPELCLPVIEQAIQLFKERADAEVSSEVFDYYPENRKPKIINLDLTWLDKFIGISIPKEQIISILVGLGFSGDTNPNNSIRCIVPSFRYHDINIKEDIAEEIARIYGYFRLPSVLPHTATSPEPEIKILASETKVKKYLANIGYHEIYNNSLISSELISKTLLDLNNHIKLTNALSEEFEYLRISLKASILQNLRNNQGKVDGPIRIFEISNTYMRDGDNNLPNETPHLCMLSTGDYRQTKGEFEALLKHLNISDVAFSKLNNQTANILTKDKQVIGNIGYFEPQIISNFGINTNPVYVEINFELLTNTIATGYTYRPTSEYPPIVESITIKSDSLIGDIMSKISTTDSMIIDVKYSESFENKHTFKVSFGSSERNLQQAEVNSIKEKILQLF